eukprot:7272149-Pyramimonas_sp.AAC.5
MRGSANVATLKCMRESFMLRCIYACAELSNLYYRRAIADLNLLRDQLENEKAELQRAVDAMQRASALRQEAEDALTDSLKATKGALTADSKPSQQRLAQALSVEHAAALKRYTSVITISTTTKVTLGKTKVDLNPTLFVRPNETHRRRNPEVQ